MLPGGAYDFGCGPTAKTVAISTLLDARISLLAGLYAIASNGSIATEYWMSHRNRYRLSMNAIETTHHIVEISQGSAWNECVWEM